jgi:hypothetical protein
MKKRERELHNTVHRHPALGYSSGRTRHLISRTLFLPSFTLARLVLANLEMTQRTTMVAT